MAPTDPNAKPRLVTHGPLVVMTPAGNKTYGVECTAGDWFGGSEVFQTEQEARYSPGITKHVMQHVHLGEHRVAVLASPADLTFTPRCLAGDFMTEDVFDTSRRRGRRRPSTSTWSGTDPCPCPGRGESCSCHQARTPCIALCLSAETPNSRYRPQLVPLPGHRGPRSPRSAPVTATARDGGRRHATDRGGLPVR